MFNFGSSNNSSGGFNFNSSNNSQAQKPATSSLFSFGSGGGTGNIGGGNSFLSQSNLTSNQQNSNSSMMSQLTATGVTYPRETNFMDLPAELRQNIENLERTIQSHADASRPFSNRSDPTEQLNQIEDKLSLLEEKISAYSCLHAQMNSKILNMKKTTSAHWRYSENTARTIEASRSSVANSGKVLWSRAFAPNDPTASHYEEILKEMDNQMLEAEGMCDALKKQIEPFVNSSSTSNQSISTPTESIKFLLKTEQEIISALQRRYVQIHDEMELMRKNYRAFCTKFRKDSRDPFAPKVTESKAKETERQNNQNSFFGINHPTTPQTSQQQNQLSFPSSTSNLLPSATTGLPTKLSTGFSFGSRN